MCSGSAASPALPANSPAPSSGTTVIIPVIQTPQGPMVPVVVQTPPGYRGPRPLPPNRP
jgi:hypothetical protein